MTSLGRGRGWASAQNKESVLRRPGGIVSTKDVDVTSLINEINAIDSDRSFQQRIQGIRNQLQNFASTENLEQTMNALYKQCLEDRKFGWKANMVFADNVVQQITDTKKCIRAYYLSALQADYTRRKELQEESLTQFRNAVLLLSGVHYAMKLSKRAFIRVIEKPLIDYSQMLLESGALEDIEILAQHMNLNGTCMSKYPTDMEKLGMNIREVLITKELCPTSRALLLYVTDLINHDTGVLPDNLQKFYESQLGDKSYVMRHPVYTENEENLEHDVDSLNMLMNAPLLDESAKTDPRKQRHFPVSSNNAVPRAIRGSGGGENKSNHGKSRRNIPAPKQISNNKGVEHDDRFEKDYE